MLSWNALFPTTMGWLHAGMFALAYLFFGIAFFRHGIRPLFAWLFQSEPEEAKAVVRHLAPPYLASITLLAANAFYGKLGLQFDWWLTVLTGPMLLILLIETLRLGIVDYWLRVRRKRAVPKILRDIVFGVVYVTALLAFLSSVFKIDLGPFLTTSAILSVVIGMALQDTLGNLFAGLAINLDRPFNMGDWVSIEGDVGQVVEITWRATKIVTRRQEMHIIPNNAISKAKVINFELPAAHYAEVVDFGCAYDIPPNRVRAIALQVAREIPGILPEPLPEILLKEFGGSAIVYQAQLWLNDRGQANTIRSEFQERLWYYFHREGITIPFSTHTVHMVDPLSSTEAQHRENMWALRRIDVIACMDAASIATLAAKAHVVHFATGERIFSQGDEGGTLYLIKRGTITLALDEALGRSTKPFATLSEGDFFGEMSLLTGAQRNASAYAASDCEFLVISRHHIAPLLEEHPEFTHLISQTIATRRHQIESAKASLMEARKTIASSQHQDSETVEEATNEIFNRIRSFFKLT